MRLGGALFAVTVILVSVGGGTNDAMSVSACKNIYTIDRGSRWFNISITKGTTELIAKIEQGGVGGIAYDRTYLKQFFVMSRASEVGSYNLLLSTGYVHKIGQTGLPGFYGMEISRRSGRVYSINSRTRYRNGTAVDDGVGSFYEINPNNGDIRFITTNDIDTGNNNTVLDLAYDNRDVLYAAQFDRIYRIDDFSGASTDLGKVKKIPRKKKLKLGILGITFGNGNTLYGIVGHYNIAGVPDPEVMAPVAYLVRIDLTKMKVTGKAKLLKDIKYPGPCVCV